MPREVPEWIGATDDTKIPDRVRVRVKVRANDCCENCGVRVRYGGEVDHIKALKLGGPNREGNLRFLCRNCHAAKSREDVALKSKAHKTQVRMANLATRRKSGFKGWRNFKGELVWRNDE
jgi:5-methylcytosine-specific restriction protein A